MKKEGTGGANTKTGLYFENKTDLEKMFQRTKNYSLHLHKNSYFEIYYQKNKVGLLFKKHNLYSYLDSLNINYKKYISKKILPDSAIFVLHKNTLNVIEMKYQQVAGSVDEKLQTCDFKRKQYIKLVSTLNWQVKYLYILNDWFRKPEYKDTLDYIISMNCKYFFNYLPLKKIGLKP